MRKLFLPVLLIAVLLLGACSSVQAPAAPTVAPTLAPTPAPTPEPTPDPTPSPSPTLDLLALYNPYRLDYLGEDLGPAEEAGGVGVEAAIERAKLRHGDYLLGMDYAYACVGLIQYQEALYYALAWTQVSQDAPEGTEPELVRYLFVSMDGEDLLEGDLERIYPMTGG